MTFGTSPLSHEFDSSSLDRPSKGLYWTGWVLSALPALFLLSGGVTAWFASPQVIASTSKFGYAPSILPVLASLEIACSVLYLIPRTSVLGAILLTAYFGGAVASHARVSDPMWVVPVVFGMVVWTGLALRRPSLRRQLLAL